MNVVIDGRSVRLDQRNVIGAGGEGTVFRAKVGTEELAVKVYHQPNVNRGKKLEAFLAGNWHLPLGKVARPLHLVYDVQGKQIVGLTMPFLGSGFEELTSLANKKYRASFRINTQMVAKIFVDGGDSVKTIHNNGFCIGDFNDLNALFCSAEMLFIDVDAWQFGSYPCPVGTEQFLAPELYGVDLSLKPMFKPEYDWYSYAVLLFRSLLCVHPYGGTHKQVRTLTDRATKHITVFGNGVTYPTIAIAPDMLNDDLSHVFEGIFSQGKRGAFPMDVLRHYLEQLTECKSCGAFYPASRKLCPICSAKTLIVITKPTTVTKDVTVTEFFRTSGVVVFHKLVGTTIVAIAYENGKAVLYTKRESAAVVRKELFNEIAGARYEVLGNALIINLPGQTELLLIDISGDQPKAITRTETSMYAGNRRAMFRTSSRYLFRTIGGNVLYGEMKSGQLIERSVRRVMADQTWFAVKHDTPDKPTVCGFFQVFGKQMFWLVWEGLSYDALPVSELEVGESLIDILVRFSSQGVLIRRLTQYQGVTYIRTDMTDTHGNVTMSAPRVRQEDHVAPHLHGQAYSTGKLLHSTDEGIVLEDVTNNSVKTYSSTKGEVQEGDVLYAYQGGMLVVKDSSVIHIVLH